MGKERIAQPRLGARSSSSSSSSSRSRSRSRSSYTATTLVHAEDDTAMVIARTTSRNFIFSADGAVKLLSVRTINVNHTIRFKPLCHRANSDYGAFEQAGVAETIRGWVCSNRKSYVWTMHSLLHCPSLRKTLHAAHVTCNRRRTLCMLWAAGNAC